MIKILNNRPLAEDLFLLTTDISTPARPGQFYMLNPTDQSKLLGRPLSIFNANGRTTDFLIATVGGGTKDLAQLQEGDYIRGSGPFGNGFPKAEGGRVALVGGGTGVAVFYHMLKLWADQADYSLFIGQRQPTKLDQYFIDLAQDLGLDLKLQHGGFITDTINYEDYDLFYTCGPRPMMDKVREGAKGKPVFMSLEKRMACGFGACLGCSIETREGQKKVCKDGPVFAGELLL